MTNKQSAIHDLLPFSALLLIFLPGCGSDTPYVPPTPVSVPYYVPQSRDDQVVTIAESTPAPAIIRKRIRRKSREANNSVRSDDEKITTLTKVRDAKEEEISRLKQDIGEVKQTVNGMKTVVGQQQRIMEILKERETRLNDENDAIDKAIKEREDFLNQKDGGSPASQ